MMLPMLLIAWLLFSLFIAIRSKVKAIATHLNLKVHSTAFVIVLQTFGAISNAEYSLFCMYSIGVRNIDIYIYLIGLN